MLRDDNDHSPFPMTALPVASDTASAEAHTTYANDDLDDVFGSEPGSPAAFGSDGETAAPDGSGGGQGGGRRGRAGMQEVSDIPRLKEKHETEGFRDGVTQGKGESVQQGFDEGYSLGALLGLKIGKILGVLEGVVAGAMAGARSAQEADQALWEAERARADVLLTAAKAELETRSVFARQYWGQEGIWLFTVDGEEEGKEVDFRDVAKSHPLVKKWEGITRQEVERWALDLMTLERAGEDEEEEKEIERDAVAEEVVVGSGSGVVAGKGKGKGEEQEKEKETTTEEAAPPETARQIMGVSKAALNW